MAGGVEYHRGGEGEPLLLVHGIGSCWQVWEPVLPALEAHRDVIALDVPGYGRSHPVEGEPTVFALADAIEEFLDSLGLEKVHVVGNSMGGALAAGLCTRGRALSGVTLSPGGLSTQRENRYSFALLRLFRDGAKRLAPLADHVSATAAGRQMAFGLSNTRPWRIEPANAAHQIRMMAASPSFDATLAWVLREHPMPPDLPTIACPFTVAWGTLDMILPPRQGPRWARIVPGARLIPLRGLGHVPMSDDPALVAKVILETTTSAASAPDAVLEAA
jgi:pimeloyl-ACP methyl ester carboxylesterase